MPYAKATDFDHDLDTPKWAASPKCGHCWRVKCGEVKRPGGKLRLAKRLANANAVVPSV